MGMWMLMSNVHVNGDVVQVEDVDVGADGGVNGDVDVNVDANIDADVDVCVCEDVLGMVMVMGMRLGVEMQVWWHQNGHDARAKAQVQFTAKRLGSLTHIAAQSHAVAVTSALSNDGAGP